MVENGPLQRWTLRLIFVGLALIVVFFQLLPLQTVPRGWAGPDLILALAIAWSLRRPDYAPAVSVAAVILLADLMFQRPPGLMAALVVIGCEHLRGRAYTLYNTTFPTEWLSVTAIIAAIALINRLVLAILVVDQAPLGLTISQVMMTALFYPAVVAVTQVVFGVRKSTPGELDTYGKRI